MALETDSAHGTPTESESCRDCRCFRPLCQFHAWRRQRDHGGDARPARDEAPMVER